MAASYNLRNKQKQISPAYRKHLFDLQDDPEVSSPKLQSKKQHLVQTTEKSTSKQISYTTTVIGSTSELFATPATNNEISSLEPCSSSLLDSAINIKKQKGPDFQLQKHQDNLDSILLQESAILKNYLSQKQVVRHEGEPQVQNGRKSYKLTHHSKPLSIPFRKCQTNLEEKIVGILNKIKESKNCEKEIDRLFTKITNVPLKQLKNKFFISGIKTLINLISESDFSTQVNENLLQKMNNSYQALKERVVKELDDISEFQVVECPKVMSIDEKKLIMRIYKILRKKLRSQPRKNVENKSILLVREYFSASKANLKPLFEELALI